MMESDLDALKAAIAEKTDDAKVPPREEAYWLANQGFYYQGGSIDPHLDTGDFCRACANAAPALAGLVVCSLLHLLGDDVGDAAWEVVNLTERSVCGGYGVESDSARWCDMCRVELWVSPTEYMAETEVDYFTTNPPRDPGEWLDLLRVLDYASADTLRKAVAAAPAWGITLAAKQPQP